MIFVAVCRNIMVLHPSFEYSTWIKPSRISNWVTQRYFFFLSSPEMPKKHVFERLKISVNDCKICASPDVLFHNNSSAYQVHTLSWTCGKVSKNTFLATAAWALMVRLLTWPSLSWIINLSKMAFNKSKTGRQLDSRQPLRDGVSLSVSSLPKNHLTNW